MLQDQYFHSDGVRLRFVEAGEGQAIILLHPGFGRIETSWIEGYGQVRPDTLAKLAENYRVVALDARGHGKSDKPHKESQYGLRMATDVVALLDHLKIEKAHLIGYSMGSLIAGKVALDYPDRVSRLVLGAGSPYIGSDHPNGLSPELQLVVDDLTSGRGMTAYVLASTPEGEYGCKPDQALVVSDLILQGQDILALSTAIAALPGLSVSEDQLAHNEIPCLAIIGDRDIDLPVLERLVSRMKNLRLEVVKGADHASLLVDSKFFLMIEEFLSISS